MYCCVNYGMGLVQSWFGQVYLRGVMLGVGNEMLCDLVVTSSIITLWCCVVV